MQQQVYINALIRFVMNNEELLEQATVGDLKNESTIFLLIKRTFFTNDLDLK